MRCAHWVLRQATSRAANPGPQRNHISWTKLISEHAKRGEGREALRIYNEMLEEGMMPSTYTLVAVVRACANLTDLETGKKVHAHLIENGKHSNVFVANSLIDMYAKCGSMIDAHQVFGTTPHRDMVSWNALINGYAHMEDGDSALQLYSRMQYEGFTPNARTFVAALKACGSLAAHEEPKEIDGELIKVRCLERGRAIHSQIIKNRCESNVFVANTLVDMYAKCGSMGDARKVFERMPHRDVVSWTAIIIGYAQMEKGELALQLYARMQHEGLMPNDRTFFAALKACGNLAAHEEAKEADGGFIKTRCLERTRAIHSQVSKGGFESNLFIANTLVDMYVKCGSMVDARQLFDRMMHRTVVSWTTMIIGYGQMERWDLALQLYACMQHEGFMPDEHTFIAVVKACSSLAAYEEAEKVDDGFIKIRCLEKGRAIHTQVAKSGFESNLLVANTLVDMYAKCGSMIDACEVFEKMTHRTVVSWTAMINGYTQMERGDLALQLYAGMQHEGLMPDGRTFVAALKACNSLVGYEEAQEVDGELVKITCLEKGRAIHSQITKSGLESDIFVATALVAMYAKCQSMADACQVFEKMIHRTIVSWTAMILGYALLEKGDMALQLYARMQHEGLTPDAYTFVAVLKACGSLASLEIGKKIHAEICKAGLEGQVFVATCLLDMYCKCGSMVDAQQLFDAFPSRDVVTWNALIAGYSGQGDIYCVLNLFERMQQENIQPDGVTFVSVLTVCRYTGLVDMGQKYFQAMCSHYGIIPYSEHYNCMADLLGRAGQLDEAVAIVKKMPSAPVVVTWMTILCACRKWNNIDIGRHAFECAVRLDGKSATAYLLMMNISMSARSAKIQEMRMDA